MKIRKSISFKLFVILAIFLATFISILIYVQLFVVSRLYLTTEYTKQREEKLYELLKEQGDRYSFMLNLQQDSENTDSNADILGGMRRYENANQAYIMVLDENYEVKYVTQEGKKTLGRFCLKSISSTLKNDIVNGNRKLIFRVRGMFGIPSKYVAISIPIEYFRNNTYEYIVTAIPEVYTGKNITVLKKYVIYIFIASILLIIIISGIFSYIITRPVIKINKSASKMIEMDFSEKCDVKSKDEIGNLANSLNFLSSKLDKTLKQLYQANEKLQYDLDVQKELDLLRKDFIAAVSHEFKTPITLIRGYTESIKDNVVRENEKEMVLDTIITEVGKMDKLVQNLLDLSSMEAAGYKLELGEFFIDELLNSISKKYSLLVKDKLIDFRSDIRYKDVLVRADSFRIEQVVTNFLNNAVANTESGNRITLLSIKEEDYIYISVENEGKHIPAEDLNRIWQKFYRTDKSRSKKSGGTGLGLSICKTILDNHSCTYGAENTECGVRFYFRIKWVSV